MSEKTNKSGGFSSIGRFFKDIVGELKKVVWPSKKQVINNTVIVLVFMATFAIVLAGLDFGISRLLTNVIFRS